MFCAISPKPGWRSVKTFRDIGRGAGIGHRYLGWFGHVRQSEPTGRSDTDVVIANESGSRPQSLVAVSGCVHNRWRRAALRSSFERYRGGLPPEKLCRTMRFAGWLPYAESRFRFGSCRVAANARLLWMAVRAGSIATDGVVVCCGDVQVAGLEPRRRVKLLSMWASTTSVVVIHMEGVAALVERLWSGLPQSLGPDRSLSVVRTMVGSMPTVGCDGRLRTQPGRCSWNSKKGGSRDVQPLVADNGVCVQHRSSGGHRAPVRLSALFPDSG